MTKKLGDKGENIALNYLLKKKYTVLEKNYRARRCEVDIIAQKKEMIIAIEVKTRNSDFLVEPWEAVNKLKQKKIITVMDVFLKKNNLNKNVRFDIISIIKQEKGYNIEHIKNEFYPTA